MHNIRWDDLQYVLAVAEHGSLSAAARALGVNHATVLRRITAFEEDIGQALFDRPPGGYRVKSEMREMLAAIESMGRTAERIERVIPTLGKGLEGTIRLTTTDSIADLLLPRILGDLARLHPKLSVDLMISNRHVDMARPDAEITLRPTAALPEGLVGTKICTMGFAVFAHPDYLTATPDTDPQQHRWLAINLPRSPIRDWQDRQIGSAVHLSADSFLTLSRLAEAGLGIAMLPAFVGRSSPKLVPAPAFPDLLEFDLWVATHPDLMKTERVATMMTFLADAIAAGAEFLA
ncbi:LysR family transcriptional regulator [Nisaea acidiphila]|uniref:LysR family transcriptional regulator n=1 Tax=Nisaea acidiphila TaxID=1862145 RepID=A0A9J7ARL4_9PROT|nr:LysR family transcriptional regulator [Nisaea acidiphila]UUX49514.1 LysR family transcriptional regulator [Nisaea acidiphila]